MGLSSTQNRIVYLGNGSSATFNFPYYFFAQTDLQVYTFDTVLNYSVQLILNTNYSISGTQNAQGLYTTGANVILNSSPNTTTDIIIFRNPPRVQNYSLLQNGAISSAALVQEFDYQTMLIQRLDEKIARSVKLPGGFGGTFSTDLPISIALSPNAAIVVNSSGTGITVGSTPVFSGQAGFVLTGNGSSAASFQAISLTGSSVTGTLSLSNGGTGGITPQEWGVVFASSATQLATTNPGPSGLPLISVASNAPIFSQLNLASAATGLLPLPNITPGTNGQVLTTGSAGVLSWQVASAAASGAALIGNNLSDMSSTSTAFKNISPMTTTGDMIIYGSNSLQVRLAAGAVNQVLTANGAGTQPTWQTNINGSGALQISQYVSGSGALLIGNNLSDVASKPLSFQNISPTTTWGDITFTGSGNIQTRLAAGTSGNVLQTGGTLANPSWVAIATGSSLTNPMTNLGDMISGGASGVAQRLVGSVTNSSAILMTTGSSGVATSPTWRVFAPPQVTAFTTTGSSTYTVPTGALYLEVELQGAGGGGGGSGTLTTAGAGLNGGFASFGIAMAGTGIGGGAGNATTAANGGQSGSSFIGGLAGFILPGSNGDGGSTTSLNTILIVGGAGGGTVFGGAGNGVTASTAGAGGTNTGGGGGGSGNGENANVAAGAGGGGGGHAKCYFYGSSLLASYQVGVPAGGGGGNAGTTGGAGGAGGSGIVVVTAYFQ